MHAIKTPLPSCGGTCLLGFLAPVKTPASKLVPELRLRDAPIHPPLAGPTTRVDADSQTNWSARSAVQPGFWIAIQPFVVTFVRFLALHAQIRGCVTALPHINCSYPADPFKNRRNCSGIALHKTRQVLSKSSLAAKAFLQIIGLCIALFP